MQLAEKVRLQRLLANLSGRFVALPSSQVGSAIEEAQQMMVQTLELDRSTLWYLAEDRPGFSLAHFWQRPELPLLPPRNPGEEKFPWSWARLSNGEMFYFSRVEDLPPEAALDAAGFREHGVQSNAAIPLVANGQTFGALAFSTMAAVRVLSEDEIVALKLVAQIVGNVVARQRAELREEQLRGELAHAMRVAALGELTAALAHELNQPLAAILSNAQAARRFLDQGEIDPAELRTILDDIVRDDKRAGAVIHHLRQMAGKQPAEREPCDLNALSREVSELMHAELIAQHIEVRFAPAPHLPHVHAARVELQQVLVNLLMNAIHAMEEIPRARRLIEIKTRAGEDSATLIIRDQGHGIPADRLAHVFEPFFSTKRRGLGIGLSVCRRLIENHGGRIEASNREAGGACFTLSLPQYRTKVR